MTLERRPIRPPAQRAGAAGGRPRDGTRAQREREDGKHGQRARAGRRWDSQAAGRGRHGSAGGSRESVPSASERFRAGLCSPGWIVPDGPWEITKPLIPPSKTRPQDGGTQDTPDKTLFTAIIYVLVIGCAWRQLPPCFGISKSTAHRRFLIWSRAGV